MDTTSLPHEMQTLLESTIWGPAVILASASLILLLQGSDALISTFYVAYGCLILVIFYAIIFILAMPLIRQLSTALYGKTELSCRGIAISATAIFLATLVALSSRSDERISVVFLGVAVACGFALNYFAFLRRRSALISSLQT